MASQGLPSRISTTLIVVAVAVQGCAAEPANREDAVGATDESDPSGPNDESDDVGTTAQAQSAFVSVPSEYVYDPSGRSGPVALHDYCTSSPDEFPAVGANASFRGPCARHDLCYGTSTDKRTCDWRGAFARICARTALTRTAR